MLLISENKLITFSQYLLTEAIKPREISYGLDENTEDKQWRDVGSNIKITFFETEEYLYTVLLNTIEGIIAFFSSNKNENEKEKVLRASDIKQILGNKKLFNRKDTSKFIHVFNYIFFIVIEAIQTFALNEIKFDGVDPALGNIYEKMTRNKYFLKYLKEINFEYIDKTISHNRDFYTFRRIKEN